jgi:transcriptional regulator with XRE-family HTH domain
MDRLAPLRKNVRREREARGWSMSELARVAGLRPSTVYRLETGSQPPRLDSLIAIADALGLAVCDLIADGASRPSSRDALDAATSGRLQHTGVTALSEDRDLRAGLGLKRAELGRLWNLSDVLARAGIVLDTPLQAVRALDLLRSLGPEAIPRKSASDAASTVRRRPGSTGNPDRAPRKPKQTP